MFMATKVSVFDSQSGLEPVSPNTLAFHHAFALLPAHALAQGVYQC
jgi:hypothetical protein